MTNHVVGVHFVRHSAAAAPTEIDWVSARRAAGGERRPFQMPIFQNRRAPPNINVQAIIQLISHLSVLYNIVQLVPGPAGAARNIIISGSCRDGCWQHGTGAPAPGPHRGSATALN